jgi:ribosomal protein L11
MIPPRERGDQPSDVEQAVKVVAGTARSMGVEVEA